MIYILLVPSSAFLIFQIFQMIDIRKHDRHLFKFCQLRRDAINLLFAMHMAQNRNSTEEFDADNRALRQLIDAINIIVGAYSKHKTVLFDFRRFIKYFRDLKTFEVNSRKIVTRDPKILALASRMQYLYAKAFLAYTPFLKHKIIVSLFLRSLATGVAAGVNSLNRYKNEIVDAVELVNQLKTRSYVTYSGPSMMLGDTEDRYLPEKKQHKTFRELEKEVD